MDLFFKNHQIKQKRVIFITAMMLLPNFKVVYDSFKNYIIDISKLQQLVVKLADKSIIKEEKRKSVFSLSATYVTFF